MKKSSAVEKIIAGAWLGLEVNFTIQSSEKKNPTKNAYMYEKSNHFDIGT